MILLNIKFTNDRRCRRTVVQGGCRHDDHQQQSQRIDNDMPLPPVDFLAAIVAMFAAAFRRLDRLTVDVAALVSVLGPLATRTACATHPSCDPKCRHHATWQNSRRRYSWATNREAACPTGIRCGSGTKGCSTPPAYRPFGGLRPIWRTGSGVAEPAIACRSGRWNTVSAWSEPSGWPG